MGRPRNIEPTSAVTFTLPTSHRDLLRAEAMELYGTEEKYANIIRSDVRAGLCERGRLPTERPRPKPQRSFVERWTMPPIGIKAVPR